MFFRRTTFSQILRSNPGLTPRLLSIRLRELQREEIIRKVPLNGSTRGHYYRLSGKGKDVAPILTAIMQYGIRHHSDAVFADGRPRALEELFPNDQDALLGRLRRYANGVSASR